MAGDRRALRQRIYSLIAVTLLTVGAIVALAGFLHLGQLYQERAYTDPGNALRALAQAQNRFRMRDLDEDGQRDYAASLRELEEAGCITSKLAGGTLLGYEYRLLRGDQLGWVATAAPLAPVTTGSAFFYVDQTQQIRRELGRPAGADSPIFWSPRRDFIR